MSIQPTMEVEDVDVRQAPLYWKTISYYMRGSERGKEKGGVTEKERRDERREREGGREGGRKREGVREGEGERGGEREWIVLLYQTVVKQ